MNFSKWFVVTFFCSVVSVIGFLVSTAFCWAMLVSLKVLIIATAPFMVSSILFFLSFCFLGEKILNKNKLKYKIKKSKQLSVKEHKVIYLNNRVA